eukprot:jgi/Mesvir1/22692/Mv14111-RA.1
MLIIGGSPVAADGEVCSERALLRRLLLSPTVAQSGRDFLSLPLLQLPARHATPLVDGPCTSPELSSSSSSTTASSHGGSREGAMTAVLERPPALATVAPTIKGIAQLTPATHSTTLTPATRIVYLFQREAAVVTPALAEVVGTDEMTTCLGLVLHCEHTKRTAVAHLDSLRSLDANVGEMLRRTVQGGAGGGAGEGHQAGARHQEQEETVVHIVGSFDDIEYDPRGAEGEGSGTEQSPPLDYNDVDIEAMAWGRSYSWPLVAALLSLLHRLPERLRVGTLCCLRQNTRQGPRGARPCVTGIAVMSSSGQVVPARFAEDARQPMACVRGLRAWAGMGSQRELLYFPLDELGCIRLKPFRFSSMDVGHALALLELDDDVFLENMSTSPYAEGPGFVPNMKRGPASPPMDLVLESPESPCVSWLMVS